MNINSMESNGANMRFRTQNKLIEAERVDFLVAKFCILIQKKKYFLFGSKVCYVYSLFDFFTSLSNQESF